MATADLVGLAVGAATFVAVLILLWPLFHKVPAKPRINHEWFSRAYDGQVIHDAERRKAEAIDSGLRGK